jgi:membrane protein DedA with SNARE-associated domain/membrane-associated phospholipid phosphatase
VPDLGRAHRHAVGFVKIGPLAFAAALAAFLVWRRRRLEPTLLVGGAIAVVGLAVYGSGVVQMPDVKQLVEDAGSTLGRWTYLVVGAMAFFETGAFVGLLAPGETFLIFGGVVAGQGTISLTALIAIVWTAAVAGDLVSFYAGRRLGRAFLVRHGPKVQITEERLATVEGFFERHGGKAILIGRFVGLVRAINPFLAGSSGMPLRRFLPSSVLGGGLWATMLLVLGYVFWHSFDRVLEYAKQGTLALGTTIVVIVAVVWVVRRLRTPEQRREVAERIDVALDRPGLRLAGRLVRPVWRASRRPRSFVWNRVTPGDLGLELTTLLAVVAVGSFALIGYALVLQDTAFTAGDLRALRWSADLRAGWLEHVAKVVTALGSPAVVAAGVGAAVVALAARRRGIEAGALLTGAALTWVVVHVTKAIVDRPRPSGALVGTDGASYPSAHAAYAVAWIAIAVVLTRRSSHPVRASAAVAVAVAVAVVVGLTRIYLRAHYFSDVVGGAGAAATCFGVCGMAALIVVHLRQNAVPT